MLAKRLMVASLIIAVGVGFTALGGWFFNFFVASFLGVAAWEYWHLYRRGGFFPSAWILIGGVPLIVLTRGLYGIEGSSIFMTLLVMAAAIIFIFQFERGSTSAAVDLVVTIGGLILIGWLGAYTISLRSMPNGLWWVLLPIPAAGIADGGGYIFGRWLGRHKLAPRVSPNKTWEGFAGAFLSSTVCTGFLAALWHVQVSQITLDKGLAIGFVIGLLTPLGDLTISLMKRQFDVKDTSNLLPGHGGILDRIDTWLWAAPIGYFLIHLLWM